MEPRNEKIPGATAALAAIDDAAAAWVARRDRGLTPAQQDEFFQWLAADPRHGERLARHQRGWNQLARLALWRPGHAVEPNPDVLAPPPRAPANHPPRRAGVLLRWAISVSLAAAAALALAVFLPRARPPEPASASAITDATYRQQVLDDGTLVELNRGAEFSVAFTAAERRVRLARGEALFTVAKNPARPFVVEAGGVTVRAVGTAFNVRLAAAGVDVLVTEGRVALTREGGGRWEAGGRRPEIDSAGTSVESPASPSPASLLPSPVILIDAGHRVVVPFAGGAPAAVAAVTREEIDRALVWQPRLLEFSATPLAEVAAEFNRRNRIQLVVADDALRALPIGASFRSDNLDGFVRLLEASFGVAAERSDGAITLRRAKR